MNERLRQARTAAGYESAAAAARRLGIAYGTYSGHENGQRGIRTEDLTAYAKAFKTTVAWLAFGDSAGEDHISIPVKGIVHGYATRVTQIDDLDLKEAVSNDIVEAKVILGKLEHDQVICEFSVPSDVVAFQVFGLSMLPHFSDGDCFFVREKQRLPLDEYLGEECFIQLETNAVMFAHEIHKHGNGSYDIVFHNGMLARYGDIKKVYELYAIVKGPQIRRAGTVLADEYRAADKKGREAGTLTE